MVRLSSVAPAGLGTSMPGLPGVSHFASLRAAPLATFFRTSGALGFAWGLEPRCGLHKNSVTEDSAVFTAGRFRIQRLFVLM